VFLTFKPSGSYVNSYDLKGTNDSHTRVNVVTLVHYTMSVTTFNVYYSNHYWADKCQGVRNLVQRPGYKMEDREFCFDSRQRQQMFFFSNAFKPAVELYRLLTK
jgi:hypothetical protein